MGVKGLICPEGISVRMLEALERTSLDFSSSDKKSSITSHGDSLGLHISSANGHKIYMYDKTYFSEKTWTSLGTGLNDDPTINNPHEKWLRLGSKSGVAFWGDGNVETNSTPNMILSSEGRLGIGITRPHYKLHVGGPIVYDEDNMKFVIGSDKDATQAWIGTLTNNGVYIGANGKATFYIDPQYRNVYIGADDLEVPTFRAELKEKYGLFVVQGVLSEDYGISPKSSWSDFVFDKGYNLRSISEVEAFISDNKHLPDVPSAQQVAEEGYSQHEMNKILLQKIEELTLYTIKQQKEIEELKERLKH